jgi:NADH-quinone oxidoreductase subunit K
VIITATHYVVLSLILLCLGLIGVMVRRNFITVLMSLELMFNAVNLNLIAFSYRLDDLSGQVLAIFVITVAAAEVAIGLGLIIALVRLKDTVALDEADVMRG